MNENEMTLVERLMSGYDVEQRETPRFTSFEEAKPFMIEVGKAARELQKKHKNETCEDSDMIMVNHMMREVENCYYSAMRADCGFNVFNAAQVAFGWLMRMYEICA